MGKKGKKSKSETSSVVVDKEPPKTIPTVEDEWVTLHLKLVNWRFANFEFKTKTSVPVFVVKSKLFEQHGRMHDLKVYKEIANPKNLLEDDFKSLSECGIRGGLKSSAPIVFTIYYDFKPYLQDDPLLLAGCDSALLEPPNAKDLEDIEFKPIALE